METKPNITVHRQVESAPPHDRELLFQRLADTIDQVFWFSEVDPERVLYVSPAFERIWGRTAKELYEGSRLWMEAIHPEDRQRTAFEFEGWLQGKIPAYRVEYRIVRPDGSIRFMAPPRCQNAMSAQGLGRSLARATMRSMPAASIRLR